METVFEGTYKEVNEVARKAQQVVMNSELGEFLVNMRMHIRTNDSVTMEEKRLDR